jgi:C_GCAxxG_C_C family probable redox protein
MTKPLLPELIIPELARQYRLQAEEYYKARKGNLCCSESIISMMNENFNGGLSKEQAVNLGAGFCHGMGNAGCTCGALAGSVMSFGLLAGPSAEGGLPKKQFQAMVKELHDRFKEKFKATCCRVLTKKVRKDPKARFANCLMLTGNAAELAVSILIREKPELAE